MENAHVWPSIVAHVSTLVAHCFARLISCAGTKTGLLESCENHSIPGNGRVTALVNRLLSYTRKNARFWNGPGDKLLQWQEGRDVNCGVFRYHWPMWARGVGQGAYVYAYVVYILPLK